MLLQLLQQQSLLLRLDSVNILVVVRRFDFGATRAVSRQLPVRVSSVRVNVRVQMLVPVWITVRLLLLLLLLL